MRRWRERYEEFGYDGLFDRRRGQPSPKRVPIETVEQVLGLYREKFSISTCAIFRRSWWRSTALG
jgi:transposase